MSFESVCADDVQKLQEIVGKEHVLSFDEVPEEYSQDEMAPVRAWPDVVVTPGSTDEVSDIMAYAYDRTLPVTPRGSGTGLMGGACAVCGGIMLDMTRMDNILEIDASNMIARIQPGVVLMNLQEKLAEHDFFYAPDPGEKTASVGGNVATNAGGMRAVKYGVTRNHIRGLEVVLPDGEVLQLGGRTAKNASGYNLMHLIIGSEGTLAVVTEIVIRLLPAPDKLVSLLVPFDSLDEAIACVDKFDAAGITPQAIEFMRRGVIEASEEYLGKPFPESDAPAYLLLRFDGTSKEELQREMEAAGRVCLKHGARDALIADTPERQDALWDARGAFLEAIKNDEIDECDIVVPRSNIAEMVLYADEVQEQIGVRIESFGHAGDGNIHINLIRDGMPWDTWRERVQRAMHLLFDKADELGGLVSGEHGIGHSKRTYFAKHTSDRQLEIMKQIKKTFDPKGILNPEKIL